MWWFRIGGCEVDLRNTRGADAAGNEAGLYEADGHVPETNAKAMEAGEGPAVAMAEKTDAGSADLVEQLSTAALAGAVSAMADAAASQPAAASGSKEIMARRFTIVTDSSRDALLTDFGKDTLDDRYLLPRLYNTKLVTNISFNPLLCLKLGDRSSKILLGCGHFCKLSPGLVEIVATRGFFFVHIPRAAYEHHSDNGEHDQTDR